MKYIASCTLLTILLFTAYNAHAQFTLVKGSEQAEIILPATEPECVQLAVKDLVNDVEKVTGKKILIRSQSGKSQSKIVIGTVGVSNKDLSQFNFPISQLAGKWESYQVKTKGKDLVIAGSDERATMFAIYHFIEKYLGIDPLYFWSDKVPEKKTALSWENIDIVQNTPSFKYRGWFINDEDLLTEWYPSGGKRNIDYPYYGQVVNPAIMNKVVESLVRQRMNLIIPASFIDIRNPAEAVLVKEAARRGVFISMHHVEPMGVSAFTFFNYWKEKNGNSQEGKPLFSFYSSRQKLEEVWRVYAQEWAKYPNVIWQIGLRGIADRPIWMADPGIPQSDADRGKLISDAMAVQMQIIQEVDKRANPPITTTLWAEGSTLNQAGHLKIPEKVTIVFADNSPGWKWQPDFYETRRSENNTYGVYYHHQLWGAGPHIAQGISPAHTHHVFQEVAKKKSEAYAILNASNIREFQLGLAASADMLYDFGKFDHQVFTDQWMKFHYGKNAGAVSKAYQLYFDAFVLHDKQQVVMLLDGQTRAFALSQLKKLTQQITDPAAHNASELKATQVSVEASWGKTSLNDAHPQPRDEAELLAKVSAQRLSHEKALTEARAILPQMAKEQRAFFESNLLAPIYIMIGLENWLEKTLLARKALIAQQTETCKEHLKNALLTFETINKGKALNMSSEKWATWYRGDKKMNIDKCKQATEEVISLLK